MNEKEIFRQINDQRLLFILLNFISQNLVKSFVYKNLSQSTTEFDEVVSPQHKDTCQSFFGWGSNG